MRTRMFFSRSNSLSASSSVGIRLTFLFWLRTAASAITQSSRMSARHHLDTVAEHAKVAWPAIIPGALFRATNVKQLLLCVLNHLCREPHQPLFVVSPVLVTTVWYDF